LEGLSNIGGIGVVLGKSCGPDVLASEVILSGGFHEGVFFHEPSDWARGELGGEGEQFPVVQAPGDEQDAIRREFVKA
jgi:hypothetical protein